MKKSRQSEGSDEKGSNEAKPVASDAALQQFLMNVHGYFEPPSLWEISQIAAMVGTVVPQDHSNLSINEAERRVALARHIWEAAGKMRKEIQTSLDKSQEAFHATMLFYGPLKIGSHFLPRVSQWDEVEGKVPFKRYLEQVIGMAREEDRMRWWRAYLTAKIRKENHAQRWGNYLDEEEKEELRTDPEWCEPEIFPIKDNSVTDAIAKKRMRGFAVAFSAGYYLEDFRKWRLEMRSPTQKADTPLSLTEAVKNGLEAENSSES